MSVEFIDIEKSYEERTNGRLLRARGDGRTVHALRRFNLAVEPGEFMVLVGPSGCGKSTALRLLAGLESPDSGDLRIDGSSITALPPQQRDVAMVFQNYALYPHMSVEQNLAFPLRMRKHDRTTVQRRVLEAAAMLDLDDLLQRKPRQLSGGQRQRVAMGRALVRDPKVFLMDEPLSNLDAKLRIEIRGEIAALQKRLGTTTLYVTHDQAEAMTLGQRVAVIKEGEIQQVDRPQQLYARPANTFVARFLGNPGMNLFAVTLRKAEGGVEIVLGERALKLGAEFLAQHPSLKKHLDTPVWLGLRPEDIVVGEEEMGGMFLDVTVLAVESLGHESLLYFSLPGRAKDKYVMRAEKFMTPGTAATLRVHPDLARAYFFSSDGSAID